MKQGRRSYRKSVRKEQIIKQLQDWHENGYANEATSYKLAKALDLVPSQNFRNILNEMVSDGDLNFVEREQPGRITTKFYYPVVQSLITEKYGKRWIVVKRKGKIAGQMEMGI